MLQCQSQSCLLLLSSTFSHWIFWPLERLAFGSSQSDQLGVGESDDVVALVTTHNPLGNGELKSSLLFSLSPFSPGNTGMSHNNLSFPL